MSIVRALPHIIPRLSDVSNSSNLTHKHGAAIIGPGGRVCAVGHNVHKSNLFIHAEMAAIINYLKQYGIKYDPRSKLCRFEQRYN